MSGVFDRPSTSNWYHTALVEAFPEVQKVELLGDAADKEVSTNFFMAKCLNLDILSLMRKAKSGAL